MASKSGSVTASRATVKRSAPASCRSTRSSRLIVLGFDRIETGTARSPGSRDQRSQTSRVSAWERAWVIIEMHIRSSRSVRVRARAMMSSSDTVGHSTRMKLLSW